MNNDNDQRFDSAAKAVSERLGKLFKLLPRDIKDQTQELRLRVNKPISICCTNGIYFLNNDGRLVCYPDGNACIAEKKDIEESFRNICNYSIYSHQNEIKSGFITLNGGHRVGISGTAVFHNGEISGMRDISSINIRIARQIFGSANELLRILKKDITGGLLLAGAPASGKTTILRDLARQLSNGACGSLKKVAVVDERGELAGTYMGIPQNDLGVCSDVLDGYPKAEGILQAVRSLSPEVVICDELGGNEEINAVMQGLNAGVSVVSSIHAGSIQEFLNKKQAMELLETGAFQSIAMLNGHAEPGKITGIYKAGDLLAQADRSTDFNLCGNTGGLYGIA